jgi:hypothetical protein
MFKKSISNLVLKSINQIFHLLARLSLTLSIVLSFLCKSSSSELHTAL